MCDGGFSGSVFTPGLEIGSLTRFGLTVLGVTYTSRPVPQPRKPGVSRGRAHRTRGAVHLEAHPTEGDHHGSVSRNLLLFSLRFSGSLWSRKEVSGLAAYADKVFSKDDSWNSTKRIRQRRAVNKELSKLKKRINNVSKQVQALRQKYILKIN